MGVFSMKTSKKVIISIMLIGAIVISFFAGRYVTQIENTNTGKAQCSTLIGFAKKPLSGKNEEDKW